MKSKVRKPRTRKLRLRKSSSPKKNACIGEGCEDESCPCEPEIPPRVLLPLLVLVFLPVVESLYFGLIFSPRYHGGYWEAWKPKWPSMETWECWWACTTSTPGLILWGVWFLSLFLLLAQLVFFLLPIKNSRWLPSNEASPESEVDENQTES